MSLARTGTPVEYRRPGRSWKLYVRPPSVGVGSDAARSGTSAAPAAPPTRLKATRPSFVRIITRHVATSYLVGSRLGVMSPPPTTRSVPPRWLVAVPRTMIHSRPPTAAAPRGALDVRMFWVTSDVRASTL